MLRGLDVGAAGDEVGARDELREVATEREGVTSEGLELIVFAVRGEEAREAFEQAVAQAGL